MRNVVVALRTHDHMTLAVVQRHGRVIEVTLPHHWVRSKGCRPVYGVDAHLVTYSNRCCLGTPIWRRRGIYRPNEKGMARFVPVNDAMDLQPQQDRQYRVATKLMEILYAHFDDATLKMYDNVHTMAMFLMSTRPGAALTLEDVKTLACTSIDLNRVRILPYPVAPIVKQPTLPPTRTPILVCADVDQSSSLPSSPSI